MTNLDEFCEYAFDHEPGGTCSHCKLQIDQYGNTEGDFLNCNFPHCGCDGARLCMAENGANYNSRKYNVEGMYQRKDKEAIKARLGLIGISSLEGK